MRHPITISILIFCALVACTKKKAANCVVACTKQGATVYFSGYSDSEIDTVYVKQYAATGLGAVLVKTDTVANPDALNISNAPNYSSPIYLDAYSTYEITIPALTYKISIVNTIINDTFPCGHVRQCGSPFAGATISGGKGHTDSLSPSYRLIVLDK